MTEIRRRLEREGGRGRAWPIHSARWRHDGNRGEGEIGEKGRGKEESLT